MRTTSNDDQWLELISQCDSGSGRCRVTGTGSGPDPAVGNEAIRFGSCFLIHAVDLPGNAGNPY